MRIDRFLMQIVNLHFAHCALPGARGAVSPLSPLRARAEPQSEHAGDANLSKLIRFRDEASEPAFVSASGHSLRFTIDRVSGTSYQTAQPFSPTSSCFAFIFHERTI